MKNLPPCGPMNSVRRKETKKMKKESIPQIEQETTITIDPLTKRASVYSCIPSMVKKLYQFAERPDVTVELDNAYGLMISVPQNWIKIRPPAKRQMTDEQKEALAERMGLLRKAKDKKKEEQNS